jgi:hypothetical protein
MLLALAVVALWLVASEGCAQGKKRKKPAVPAGDDKGGPLEAGHNTGAVKGVFALSTGTNPIAKEVMTNPDLTGVSLRAGWSDVEPEETRFVWHFDADIEQARKAGKQVMLRVSPGARSPQWVYTAGAKPFVFQEANPHKKTQGETMQTPIPWDPVFLKKWTAFIKAMGRKYADNPTVVLIQMVGPNKHGGEMHLPKTAADKQNWDKAGYSKDKLVGAYKVVIDAYDEAFPQKPLALDVAIPVYQDGAAEEILAYAQRKLGKRFCVQHNALAAKTSEDANKVHQLVRSYDGKATVGYQLLCSATGKSQFTGGGTRFGGSLREAFAIGLRGGGSYFEIYTADLDDAECARHIHELAVALGK